MSNATQTAIITGASAGIGRATAIALSNAGWNLSLTARREHALVQTVELCANPDVCLPIAGDVTDELFVKSLFSDTVNKFGRIDLNAGISAPQVDIEDLSLATFQNVLNVNITGPFLCTREAFKVFKSQDPPGGRIINNGSLSAHVPRPHSYAYTASKHAISGLTKCTSLDGRPHNIACTQIDIGNALTDLSARLNQGALQPDGRMVPEAMIDVQYVAEMIVHIAALPNDVTILEVNIMPTKAPYVGRG